MNRLLVIVEGPDRGQVVANFLTEVNTKLADNWWIVANTLVEFVAPRKGGFRYAFAVELEQEVA